MNGQPIPTDAAVSGGRAVPGVLFFEDFDDDGVPPPAPAPPAVAPPPPPPPPSFTQADLDLACAQAFASGAAEAAAAAAAQQRAMLDQGSAIVARALRDAGAEATRSAEAAALATARLLFAALATLFPALCARHAGIEIAALAQAVLPALDPQERATLLVHPQVVDAAAAALGALDAALRARLPIAADDRLAPGDARLVWPDGAASRDTAALWAGVAAALRPLGLLADPPDADVPASPA